MLFCTALPAQGVEGSDAYDLLQRKADTLARVNQSNGWAYLISGGIVTGVSIPGYYLSNDVFAKTVYSIGQMMGVAAVGYGTYLVLIENDDQRFVRVLRQIPELSGSQKNQLARAFLRENAARARSVRKIRVITHSLTASLNFLNAATSPYRDLKTALYFLGGINAFAALGAAFFYTEEEKLANTLEPPVQADVGYRPGLGPVAALKVRF